MLCQYNNIYVGSYKYLKERKSTNGRLEKKNVATVATMPLGTIATIKKKKVAHQNGTTYEQWKTLYEQCKNTVEKIA